MAWKRFCHYSYSDSGGHHITIKSDNISLTVSTCRRFFFFKHDDLSSSSHFIYVYVYKPIPYMLSRPKQCERPRSLYPRFFSHDTARLRAIGSELEWKRHKPFGFCSTEISFSTFVRLISLWEHRNPAGHIRSANKLVSVRKRFLCRFAFENAMRNATVEGFARNGF